MLCASCDIERLPHGDLPEDWIDKNSTESLDALLTGCYGEMKGWADVMHRCGEYAGDNIMIRGTTTDPFYEFITYAHTTDNTRVSNFWNRSYKIIAQASNIINHFPEGQDEVSDQKLGECYFMRGMMYFYLCRAFGRPYYQRPKYNKGVPIVNGTPEATEKLRLPDRSTVYAVYKQIIADLEHAAQLMTIPQGPSRASRNAAYALLSRVYLHMSGTYKEPSIPHALLAAEYATKVIEAPEYSLLPRERFMLYNTIKPENNPESIFVVKRLASEFAGNDLYYTIGGMYAKINGIGWGEMYASAKYLKLLDETGRNDWRSGIAGLTDARAAFIVPQYEEDKEEVFRFIKHVYPARKGNTEEQQIGFNYIQATILQKQGQLYCVEYPILYRYDSSASSGIAPVTDEAGNEVTTRVEYPLTPVSEQEEIYEIENYNTNNNLEPVLIRCRGVIDRRIKLNQGYPMFYITKCSLEEEGSQLHSPIISRLGEIYLNRAEAYAKLERYEEARKDLNKVRERSLPGESYPTLNASNAAERIEKERQLELAFQAERTFDVYRNGNTMVRRYPGAHSAMEDISPTDFRVVYYIPQSAINAYPPESTLTQNPTSN